jgi:hypothetical protein
VAGSLKDFGTLTNAAGVEMSTFPTSWLVRNYLDINEDTWKLMEDERKREFLLLGYDEQGKPKEDFVNAAMGTGISSEMNMGSGIMDDIIGQENDEVSDELDQIDAEIDAELDEDSDENFDDFDI